VLGTEEQERDQEMTQIILDTTFASKLNGLTQAVQLCDPAGRVLGQFVPALDLSEWEPVSPDVTEEELDHLEQSTEWYTTEEVLAHLKTLENK
jgi:hypothetical protein